MDRTRDFSQMAAGVLEAVDLLKFGSFSQRHPSLGKMRRCPFCRQRRREFSGERCCNTAHATSQRAWSAERGFHQAECEPRVTGDQMPKSFMRKVMHKRRLSPFRKLIHEKNLQFQTDPMRMQDAIDEFTGVPKFHHGDKKILPEHAASFADRVCRMERKEDANVKRKQQKISRRINLGLARQGVR